MNWAWSVSVEHCGTPAFTKIDELDLERKELWNKWGISQISSTTSPFNFLHQKIWDSFIRYMIIWLSIIWLYDYDIIIYNWDFYQM